MINDELYPYYLTWLLDRLDKNEINSGEYELFKISESFFLQYKSRYNKEYEFRNAQSGLYKSLQRQDKIDKIIDTKSNI